MGRRRRVDDSAGLDQSESEEEFGRETEEGEEADTGQRRAESCHRKEERAKGKYAVECRLGLREGEREREIRFVITRVQPKSCFFFQFVDLTFFPSFISVGALNAVQ